MTLYHTTRESLAPRILAEGLRPRAETGQATLYGDAGVPALVFLAGSLEKASQVASGILARLPLDERPVIFAVVAADSLVPRLLPDEDFLYPGGTWLGVPLEERLEACRRQAARWRASLAECGTVAHDGPIQARHLRLVERQATRRERGWIW